LEAGERKLLNFGHTIGHAIETYSLKNDDDALLHGEAIAIGIICESYLSMEKLSLPEEDLYEIVKYIFNHYHAYNLQSESIDELIKLMVQDKKNTDDQINFTLISGIGKGLIDQFVNLDLIKDALNFYIRYINTTD
jgi:3-dehydroquinate synthase